MGIRNWLGFFDRAAGKVIRHIALFFMMLYTDTLKMQGVYRVRCYGPDGVLKWEDTARNLICNTALNDVLNAYIRATTQTTAWYMGLVDNSGFTAFAAADTSASHGGWTENQSYSNGSRPQWSPGAASSQSITNASSVNFSMTATATIRGIFIASVATLGATTGILFSEAAFSGGNQSVNSGDTLQCTYTLSLASN